VLTKTALASVTVAAVIAVACTSGSVLDETGAARLIQASIGTESFMVSVADLVGLMRRSPNDYRSANNNSTAAAKLRRLIEGGFVKQTVEAQTYPDISGTWIYERTESLGTASDTWNFTITLAAVPSSDRVLGNCSIRRLNKSVGGTSDERWSHQVNGSVREDGLVQLSGGRCFGDQQPVSYHYKEDAKAARLQPINPTYRTYTGTATGRTLRVTWYTYAFGERVAVSTSSQNTAQVASGQHRIGEVTNLHLLTETHAAANFAWTVSFNEVGRLLLDSAPQHGTGTAEFVKKPDGTWVLAGRVRF
jgi:hypothetical protein